MKIEETRNEKVLAGVNCSTLQHDLACGVYAEWEDRFGFGPCGALAVLLREAGYGHVAVCQARGKGQMSFTHYVNVTDDGWITDLANPLDEPLTYEGVEVLNDDEMPELVGSEELAWLRERITLEGAQHGNENDA